MSSAAYDGGMNKRSILTAVLALGLGVTALTGCNSNTLSAGKPDKNIITLHPLKVTGEDAAPVTVTLTDKDGITTDFKVTVTEGAN